MGEVKKEVWLKLIVNGLNRRKELGEEDREVSKMDDGEKKKEINLLQSQKKRRAEK